ncbi:monovalent cation/H(+) antiporter subunit G [Capnocytophaga canimorsus]|uniref:monovalent cation/H(+) antiporter subunit G n=1 Tax=Capnocytophaga canimorsus TaxID=28188 RepID=UPI001EE14741|nr:monovalent cation/H(+) antiporter subunit G [Capnocytophaga canimorsus]GJQ04357.1 Na+/H+ antiporter subunit G [Capnocytophaga canimorsus]
MTNYTDYIIAGLSLIGALFVLLAAVGIYRMPDTFLRISVTTKAATLGVGLILIALAVFFNENSVSLRVIAIVLFIMLTAPVSAHLIGRAAYLMKAKLWEKTLEDDLKGKYAPHTEELKSESEKVNQD